VAQQVPKHASVVDVECIVECHADEGVRAPWSSMVEDVPRPLLYIES
jgi:hypothetical protein